MPLVHDTYPWFISISGRFSGSAFFGDGKSLHGCRGEVPDFCKGAFAYDLDGDSRKEYFVRLSCGATGNCIWGLFSDRPARLRGVFSAWFFYIHGRSGGWNGLTTYTREGGDQGVIATMVNHRGKYVQMSERTERGYYGNSQPFLRRMGVPKCS